MKREVKRIYQNFLDALKTPELRILPGQLAFYILMSMIPIIAIISLIASIIINNFDLANALNGIIPSALSNIIKQLNVGANRILGCNRKQRTINSNNLASQNTQVSSQNNYNKTTQNPNNSQSQIRPSNLSEMNNIFMPYPMTPPKYDYMHRPPHHPRPNMSHGCKPHDIILSDQCDIVRMILLYMMLRPNCRYISRLCNVANDQFEILQLLM